MSSTTPNSDRRARRWLIPALIAFAVVLLSPWASRSPDGLEWVAEVKGFFQEADPAPAWNHAPMPDYAVPAMEHEAGSTMVSGVVGVLLVMGLSGLMMKWCSRRQRPASQP